jgi:putative ABC transport system substrate-binding protein
VIVAPGAPAAVAAKQVTGTIPIVFVGVADAVGSGLAANFARPTANITGLTSDSAQLGGKRLELLKAVVPKASRMAVLYNPGDSSNVLASRKNWISQRRHSVSRCNAWKCASPLNSKARLLR